MLREAEVAALLSGAPHPVRDLAQNLADLRAQVAANARGGAELRRMVDEFGPAVVQAYMRHVQDNAEEAVRRAIDRIGDGSFRQEMDDGSVVAVRIAVDREAREATVDFTGTSKQRADNFNAPAAVCTAAVLYVFRTLVDAEIPLNAGCLRPLHIVIPPGSMLDPKPPAAVAAGNVETSQAITNALFGALGVCAASQGTMNNLTFGDDRYQYYETVCGGAGAGPTWDGCSAVHTHMTNSRLTDPEVLEWRYPVRVEEFRVRRGSGGAGAHRGGDGVVRRLRFLEPLTAALVSGSRRVPPYGLAGGRSRRARPQRGPAHRRRRGGASRRRRARHGGGRRAHRGDAGRRRLRRAARADRLTQTLLARRRNSWRRRRLSSVLPSMPSRTPTISVMTNITQNARPKSQNRKLNWTFSVFCKTKMSTKRRTTPSTTSLTMPPEDGPDFPCVRTWTGGCVVLMLTP